MPRFKICGASQEGIRMTMEERILCSRDAKSAIPLLYSPGPTNFRDPFKLRRHYWHSSCQDYWHIRHTAVMHGSHLWQKESWISQNYWLTNTNHNFICKPYMIPGTVCLNITDSWVNYKRNIFIVLSSIKLTALRKFTQFMRWMDADLWTREWIPGLPFPGRPGIPVIFPFPNSREWKRLIPGEIGNS